MKASRGEAADPLAGLARVRRPQAAALRRLAECEAGLDGATDDASAWSSLGDALLDSDEVDEALGCFERALELDRTHADAFNGMANVRRELGELDRAITLYRRALEVAPDHRVAFQNLLFALLCSDTVGDAEVFDWHTRFSARFEAPLAPLRRPHPNSRDPERALRIGYVSPDFRRHVVGACIAPVIERHDRGRFAVHCYASGPERDDLTDAIRARADAWREVAGLDDAQLEAQIRADRIDLLVDLSGHTPGNRLLALARKPAPVQLTYLDYSATTGLASIDYRLTDERCDPAGAEHRYSERLLRLSRSYWVYNPPPLPAPAQRRPGAAPLLGCLNSYYRIGDAMLAQWARILARLPGARLVLVGVPHGRGEQLARERFARAGGDPARLELFGLLPYDDYIALIQAVDIALAPFPYSGAMTLLDCLWNGVPVISRTDGTMFRSRMGASILGTLGLDELGAPGPDAYAERAVALASDAPRLAGLRTALRARVERSPLRDFPGHTRALEDAYRASWRAYCAAG